MDELLQSAITMSRKSTDDALALVSQTKNIPKAGCVDEHPYVLARCGGVKTFDNKSNVVVSDASDESNVVGFKFSKK